MPARTLLAVGAGIASALIFSVILTGSPLAIIVMPFTMLPLFLIGLSSGTTLSLVAAAAATALVAAMGGLMGAVTFAAAEAVPAVAISGQALRQRASGNGQAAWLPSGHLMGYATAYGVLLMVAVFIGFSGFEGGFVGLVEQQIAMSFQPMAAQGPEAREMLSAFASQIAELAPGSMTAWWLFITLVNLGIAQALLRRWKHNLRPNLSMLSAETPKWVMFALGAALLMGALAGGTAGIIGWNAALVLAMPYIFVGLAVIHALCRGWSAGPFFLGGFYIMLLFRGWPALIAVALGFAEQWVKLRDKIGGPAPS